jgi:hypothetical protein
VTVYWTGGGPGILNPAAFVEVTGANPPARPAAGTPIRVKNALTGVELSAFFNVSGAPVASVATLIDGYVCFGVTDVQVVDISADNWTTTSRVVMTTALQQAVAGGGEVNPSFIRTGLVDNSATFGAALAVARDSTSTMPYGVDVDFRGNVCIDLPAGDIMFDDVQALLGQEAPTSRGAGLRFRGRGQGITRLIFKPTAAGDFGFNDYWRSIQFDDMSFYAATAGCTFFHTNTTHAAQEYSFYNCEWYKWKFVFYLEGNNNNSEYKFFGCSDYETQADGAFLRIPSTGSDQFLNYWFYGFKHWSTSAPIVWADKGGHFKFYGLDVSDFGVGLAATAYVFRVKGNIHAAGVCSLHVDGMRWEAKSNFCALLESEWGYGNISFTGLDMSSQAYPGSGVTYDDIIKVTYGNDTGPHIAFRDSFLAGKVRVLWGPNGWARQHRILFEDCDWMQQTTPDAVVVYDSSASGGVTLTTPPVEFRRCRADEAPNVNNGTPTWDCTIGWRGDSVQALEPRVLSVRDAFGTPNTGDVLKVRLPIGAMITSFEALSPAGAVGEADGGSWTLATTDGSPVTVATASVAGAMSAGFSVAATPATPFDCSTAAKATLTITPASVAQTNPKAVLLIKGYW